MPVSKQTKGRTISFSIYVLSIALAFILGIFFEAHNIDNAAKDYYDSFKSPESFLTGIGAFLLILLQVYRTFRKRKGE